MEEEQDENLEEEEEEDIELNLPNEAVPNKIRKARNSGSQEAVPTLTPRRNRATAEDTSDEELDFIQVPRNA